MADQICPMTGESCKMEECAWWATQRCSIREIALQLSNIDATLTNNG